MFIIRMIGRDNDYLSAVKTHYNMNSAIFNLFKIGRNRFAPLLYIKGSTTYNEL